MYEYVKRFCASKNEEDMLLLYKSFLNEIQKSHKRSLLISHFRCLMGKSFAFLYLSPFWWLPCDEFPMANFPLSMSTCDTFSIRIHSHPHSHPALGKGWTKEGIENNHQECPCPIRLPFWHTLLPVLQR